MIHPNPDFEKDIQDISLITAIPTMLNVICRTTGMGFAAVARVTEDKWITCSVRDEIGFGLKPGDELKIETTICNEIRQSGKAVIIDSVKDHPHFCSHHTPAIYGFQSYISVPIVKKDGSFFGTLCAIDPKSNVLTSVSVSEMFNLFADLISFHLNALDAVRNIETKLAAEQIFNLELEKKVFERTIELEKSNKELLKINKELQSFTYISSHDLQEPLRKIQTIASLIEERENSNLSEKGKDYFKRIQISALRMRTLINDLLTYSRTNPVENNFQSVNLKNIIDVVINDLDDSITTRQAKIYVNVKHSISAIDFQMKQLFYNLINNALKFSSPERISEIKIDSKTGTSDFFNNPLLSKNLTYCCITISDNGVGFDKQYSNKIFELFQRLNSKNDYDGTGIGLTIAKKIVENHNGIIIANGKANIGAVFNVYLPQ